MKKIIMIMSFLAVYTTALVAQKAKETPSIPDLPVNSETGLITYTDVNQVAGATKDQLYKRALSWANSYYKNPGDVIRERDPEKGRILIKARYRLTNEPDKKGLATAAGDVMYSLTFQFKEGRYKYEITNINWQQISYYPIERWKDTEATSFKPAFAHYLKQTDETLREVIRDFEKQIATAPKVKADIW